MADVSEIMECPDCVSEYLCPKYAGATFDDPRDAELARWRQLAADHQAAAEGVADLYVEIQEAVADAHGQLTDDGLCDDDYDAVEGVRMLRAQRDRLLLDKGELADAIVRLLQSSDAEWEERNHGHDWRDAVEHAREVLGIHPGGL